MYIEKRRRKQYAIHDIPKDVREILGTPGKPKVRFMQSLDTEDLSIAKRRAVPLEARWRLEIEQARGTVVDPVELQARYWRGILLNAPDHEKPLVRDMIAGEARTMIDRAATKAGVLDARDAEYQDLEENVSASRFFAIASGQLVPFDEHLEEYAATLNNEPKSIAMKKSTVKKFAEQFAYVSDVERKAVQKWVNQQATDGKAVDTVRRCLSELRGYWNYLVSLEAAPESSLPFDRLSVPKPSKRNKGGERSPFTPAQVVGLLHAAINQKDEPLADLIRLGMWTGARLESLCILKIADVGAEAFNVLDDKSPAGRRTVPIHSQLKPIIERLKKASSDGYVLPGLTLSKYGDRSGAIGKRFGRLKTAQKFGEDHVFHSIRKTVATMLDNAGVPENVAADILGHDKPTMTYGLYSGGASLEVKMAAIEKLTYPQS